MALRRNTVSNVLKSIYFSNIFYPVELADKERFRNCNTHNNRPVMVLILSYNFHIHKNIGKHLSALFPLFCIRSLGKLLLIVI